MYFFKKFRVYGVCLGVGLGFTFRVSVTCKLRILGQFRESTG